VSASIRDDPYLVVAADKGTATFSDTANGISQDEYGFWLGDAFASGGSAGYDHKKMGITARGAWERSSGISARWTATSRPSPSPLSGVGDMSGDVFGNGMLLSKARPAWSPPSTTATSSSIPIRTRRRTWAERKRLFELGRSSWQDYNPELISKGGGIFSRQLKSIVLSTEIRALIGLSCAN
jgi:glutamate dehydrogenase